MCFILDLFNSCSFKTKKRSTNTNNKSSNNNNNTSLSTIKKINNKPVDLSNSKLTINNSGFLTNSSSQSDLNENTLLNNNKSIEINLNNSVTTIATNSFETAEKIREHFNFKSNLVYFKLESFETNHNNNSGNHINKIIDYCNNCGYYCCECNIMKSNNNNINNNQNNVSALSSPSLSSLYSSNATLRPTINLFQPNNPTADIDIDMKPDFSYHQQSKLIVEKPNQMFFTNQRFNNQQDIDMETETSTTTRNSPFLTPKPFKRPNLEIGMKKHQFIFDSEHILSAKPIVDNKELSDILDKELVNSRSETTQQSISFSEENSNSNDHSPMLGLDRGHHRNRSHRSKSSKSHRDGKIIISKEQIYDFKEIDLQDLGQIGYGEFGTVHKVLHKPSQTCMALKRIRPTVGSQGERKKVLKELDFVLECQDYTHVVKFYGVKLNNEPAENLICMELMDTSLEKFYKFVYEKKREEIPEEILGKIVVATVSALNYLKESHKIIHRDVKPSNILLNKQGEIKMCDFGISGKLVDSIAASRDAGCQLYMAVSICYLFFSFLF